MENATILTRLWSLGGRQKRWFMWIGCSVLILAMLVLAANIALCMFLRSQNLLDRISTKTAKELKAPSGYLPLSWNGLSVYSDGLLVQGQPSQALRKLQAQRLHAQCGLASLWH